MLAFKVALGSNRTVFSGGLQIGCRSTRLGSPWTFSSDPNDSNWTIARALTSNSSVFPADWYAAWFSSAQLSPAVRSTSPFTLTTSEICPAAPSQNKIAPSWGITDDFFGARRTVVQPQCATTAPSNAPTVVTSVPSQSPTHVIGGGEDLGSPTMNPTLQPTKSPTLRPSHNPTRSPTRTTTKSPTKLPTAVPTANTLSPSRSPTGVCEVSGLVTCCVSLAHIKFSNEDKRRGEYETDLSLMFSSTIN